MNWIYRTIDDQGLPQYGHATYRLAIVVNEPEETYGLRLNRIYTAYKLWIDGELVAESGEVGNSSETAVPKLTSSIVFFQPENQTVDLVLQVSNYEYYRSGIIDSIVLGTQEQILRVKQNQVAFSLFLAGIFFIMAVYHIILYLIWRKDASPLYFGIFTFFIFLQTLFERELFFSYLFPHVSFQLEESLQNIVIFFMLPSSLAYLHHVFDKKISRFMLRLVTFIVVISSFGILLLPFPLHEVVWHANEIVILLTAVYIFYFMIRYALQKTENAFIFVIGFFVLAFTMIYDIFIDLGVLPPPILEPIGMLIFLFTQTVMIANKISQAFTQVEELSTELHHKNQRLQEAYAVVEEQVKKRTEELKESEEKYWHLADATFEGIVIHDTKVILEINARILQLLGYEENEVIGKSIYNFFPVDQHQNIRERVQKTEEAQYETRLIKKDNRLIDVEILARGFKYKGKSVRVAAIRDITARKQAEKELKEAKKELEKTNTALEKEKRLLEKMAITDGLTEIHNHRYIVQKLQEEIERAKRYDHSLTVVMFDIDYFKRVNDTYGHQVGDEVLRIVSQLMKDNLRNIDSIGRYGGEEFLIILPETTLDEGFQVAERIRSKVEHGHYGKEDLRITISGGVAEYNGESDVALLKKADDLLYLAKENGRNRLEKD